MWSCCSLLYKCCRILVYKPLKLIIPLEVVGGSFNAWSDVNNVPKTSRWSSSVDTFLPGVDSLYVVLLSLVYRCRLSQEHVSTLCAFILRHLSFVSMSWLLKNMRRLLIIHSSNFGHSLKVSTPIVQVLTSFHSIQRLWLLFTSAVSLKLWFNSSAILRHRSCILSSSVDSFKSMCWLCQSSDSNLCPLSSSVDTTWTSVNSSCPEYSSIFSLASWASSILRSSRGLLFRVHKIFKKSSIQCLQLISLWFNLDWILHGWSNFKHSWCLQDYWL